MRIYRSEWTTDTREALQMVDITARVQETVAESDIRVGHATVACGDSDCSLIVNEFESGLISDIRKALDGLGATSARDRRAVLGSGSVVLPIVDGTLRLGTWQRVLLVELDEGKARTVIVQVVGE